MTHRCENTYNLYTIFNLVGEFTTSNLQLPFPFSVTKFPNSMAELGVFSLHSVPCTERNLSVVALGIQSPWKTSH